MGLCQLWGNLHLLAMALNGLPVGLGQDCIRHQECLSKEVTFEPSLEDSKEALVTLQKKERPV